MARGRPICLGHACLSCGCSPCVAWGVGDVWDRIQAAWRKALAERLYRGMYMVAMVTRVQSVYRGHLQRRRNKYVRRKKAHNYHATQIQR